MFNVLHFFHQKIPFFETAVSDHHHAIVTIKANIVLMVNIVHNITGYRYLSIISKCFCRAVQGNYQIRLFLQFQWKFNSKKVSIILFLQKRSFYVEIIPTRYPSYSRNTVMEISRFENRARKSGKLAHKEAYNKFVLSLVAFSGEDPF